MQAKLAPVDSKSFCNHRNIYTPLRSTHVDCATTNAVGLGQLFDSLIAVHVEPNAHPVMVDTINALLAAVDGRSDVRVEWVRVALARGMFRDMMAKVCHLLARFEHLSPSTSDADWSKTFILIHDVRDIFVHSRVPGAVIHHDFGRMCAGVCDALAISEPGVWLARAPLERNAAVCVLLLAMERSLVGFLKAFRMVDEGR